MWTWDITKLLGPAEWTYYYLYVILDIFSRYVVGRMLALHESARLAKRLIAETTAKQRIGPAQLTIRADRGSSMKSQGVAALLAALGITRTHSRPRVSNDKPYSEAQFKTLKYCPGFPDRFGSYQDGLAFCHAFFRYYNHEHRHSGIGLMTPDAPSSPAPELIEVAHSMPTVGVSKSLTRSTPRPGARGLGAKVRFTGRIHLELDGHSGDRIVRWRPHTGALPPRH